MQKKNIFKALILYFYEKNEILKQIRKIIINLKNAIIV